MPGDDALCRSLPDLLTAARPSLPLVGLGVVRRHSEDQLVLSYTDPFGATAYRGSAASFPASFRPRPSELVHVSAADLDANGSGLLESRLRHGTFSEAIRDECAV